MPSVLVHKFEFDTTPIWVLRINGGPFPRGPVTALDATVRDPYRFEPFHQLNLIQIGQSQTKVIISGIRFRRFRWFRWFRCILRHTPIDNIDKGKPRA